MVVDTLSVHLLGSPNITWLNKQFPLARRQARALLFRLSSTLQPISRQQLGFILWPDDSEAEARRNLNRLLSYLHNALPRQDMLILLDDSVQLDPELVWSDADEFTRLCANMVVERAGRAVELYRGSFLEGFYLPNSLEYDLWLTEERERYERLYLSALAELVGTLVDRGEYQQAIPYAQRYLKFDNLAEEIHLRLIACYAATGNRAAAQTQYEQMVVTLEKELGVAPLPETTLFYISSLKGEKPAPHTLPAPAAWSVLPSLEIPMIGRRKAWQELEAVYQGNKAGGVILIAGEAGIGKSRILKEFAAKDHKCVINGNIYPSTQGQSYRPLVQALEVALPHKWLWQGVSPIWLSAISLILPDIKDQFPDLPERKALNPQQAQSQLFEGLTQVFLGLAINASPLLLCLDDLQWADPMTLEWLQYLAPRIHQSNLCILATCRSEKSEKLVELRRILNRSGKLHEIGLTGLKPGTTSEMIDFCGAAHLIPDSLRPRLHQITGGNPFFTLEVIRAILEGGSALQPDSFPITSSIQTLVDTRLARLTMVARQVLEACAVLAPRLDFDLIALTSGRQEFELAEALDELTLHHLLEENEGYAFRHELIRQAVYQGLSQWRSQLLHKRAAEAYESAFKKKLDDEHAQIAYHYDRAAKAGPAVTSYFAAAEHAKSIYAYQTAVGYLQRAIELLPGSGETSEFGSRVYGLLGDCLSSMGNLSQAREYYDEALFLLGKDQPLRKALILRKCAAAFGGEFAYDDAIPLLDRALQILEAQSIIRSIEWQHIWLDIQLERIWIYYQKALPDQIDQISAQIRPVIDQVGTPRHQIQFITGINYAVVRKNRYRVSETVVESERRALAFAEQEGDAGLICERQFNTGILSLLHGDADSAVRYLSAGLGLAQKIGLLPLELQCLVYLMAAYRVQGNEDGARQLAPRCLETARLVGQPNYTGAALAHQAWLAYRTGDSGSAKELALQAMELWKKTQTYPFQWMGLWLLLETVHSAGESELALQYVAAIIDPIQQAAPDEIENLLQAALHASQEGQVDLANAEIGKVLHLARQEGYL